MLVISVDQRRARAAGRGCGVARDRAGVARARRRLRSHDRAARRRARLRGDARHDLERRRHGRRGDDLAARARGGGPQLRLPLRLDPRPVLRRRSRRPRRRARDHGRLGPLRDRAAGRARPGAAARLHRPRHRDPRERSTSAWRATRAAPPSSATRSATSSSSTSSARSCCCSPPAARHDHLDADGWRAAELAAAAVLARWREPDAGIWELDPPRALDPQPPDLRRRPARDLGARAGPPPSSRWLAAADAIVADDQPPRAAPVGSLAARPRRSARRRGAAAGRVARRRRRR